MVLLLRRGHIIPKSIKIAKAAKVIENTQGT